MPEEVRRRWAIRLRPHRGRRARPPWRRGCAQGWLGLRPMSPGASPCGSWPQPSSRPELPLPRGASPPAPDFSRRSGCAGGRGPSSRRRCRTRGSGGLWRVLRACPLRSRAGPGRLPLPRPRGLRLRSAAIQPLTEHSAPACGRCLNICLCLSPCRPRCVCLRLRSPPPRGRRARRGCRSRMPGPRLRSPSFPARRGAKQGRGPGQEPGVHAGRAGRGRTACSRSENLDQRHCLDGFSFRPALLQGRRRFRFAPACVPAWLREAGIAFLAMSLESLPAAAAVMEAEFTAQALRAFSGGRDACPGGRRAEPACPAPACPVPAVPALAVRGRRPRDAQDGGAGMRAQRRLHRAWP